MTPRQFKKDCKMIWGHRWCSGIAGAMCVNRVTIHRMMRSGTITPEAIDALLVSMQKKRDELIKEIEKCK